MKFKVLPSDFVEPREVVICDGRFGELRFVPEPAFDLDDFETKLIFCNPADVELVRAAAEGYEAL